MLVLSSENPHFLWPVRLCDVRGALRAVGVIVLFQVLAELTLDLHEKLLNAEWDYPRRSFGMVKISFFIAAIVVLSACDVPFIPGI